jgi:beta-lactamase regulating signal transducer with metallopeptidase domain
MTLEAINQSCSSMLAYAGESAVRSIALALAAGFVVSVARIKQSRLRLISWSGVLYAAMAMPLLGLLLPALNVPLLPAARHSTATTNAVPGGPAQGGLIRSAGDPGGAAEPASAFAMKTAQDSYPMPQAQTASAWTAAEPAPFAWWGLVAIVYLLVGSILLARVATGLVLGRLLRKKARQIDDPEIGWLIHQLSGMPIRSARVKVAESSSVSIPVAIGALDPMILLPSRWQEWDSQKLRAVLAHELSHVARRDALTQLVSAVHRSVFWFSPLAWWLHGRLIDLAEQASDDSALQVVQDPAFYAEVVLGFFQSLNAVPARWLGVSMARGARAGRRIERMLSSAVPLPARLKGRWVAGVVVVSVVLTVLAGSIRIGRANWVNQTRTKTGNRGSKSWTPAARPGAPILADVGDDQTGSSSPISALAVVAGGDDDPVFIGDWGAPIVGSGGQQAPTAPPPPAAGPVSPAAPAGIQPVAPLMALAPPAPVSPAIAGSVPFAAIAPFAPVMAMPPPALQDGEAWTFGGLPDHDSYAIVTSDGSIMTTGSWRAGDEAKLKSLRDKIKTDFIWFRRDGRSYVVTDPGIVKAAKDLFAEQGTLGRRQAELGAEQGRLGEKQAELARQMATIKVDVPDLTEAMRKLSDSMKGVKTQEKLAEVQARVAELQARLAASQANVGKLQFRLGESQSDLGREQSKLGRMQSQLGQEQSRLAREAWRKLRSLLDRALSDGVAQPEP